MGVREVPSSFVGRARELALIEATFEDGARLVTVVAPGGFGKTRVAARFAAAHEGAYAEEGGGAWSCDLAEATDRESACAAVAAELDIGVEDGGAAGRLPASIGRAIARKRRVLIVLDGFEPVADVASETLGVWMQLAPDARFLVTSRVSTGLPGEHVVELGPLELPADRDDEAALRGGEAVELFVRRARQVRPRFEPSAAEMGVLADVVRATDGIPLAIELAAARVSVLTLEELRARLGAPFDVFVRRDDRGKHGSMRRVLEDSFGALDREERAALSASSVFRGGFTLEAAEHVLADDGVEVMRALDALVARGLVQARPRASQMRFATYAVVREMAKEELERDARRAERIALRHAAFFAAFAERAREAETELVEPEIENAIGALTSLLSRRQASGVLPLAVLIAPSLLRSGRLSTCVSLLDGAIGAAPDGAPHLARALVARAMARRQRAELELSRADVERAFEIARRDGDPTLEALAWIRRGEIVEIAGETREAIALFSRALERIEAVPGTARSRTLLEAEARAHRGHALRREGDLDRAEREIKLALSLYERAGAERALPMLLYEAGVIALFRGDREGAGRDFASALDLARRLDHRQAEGAALCALGILAQERGQLDCALGDLARAARVFEEIGARDRASSALYSLGAAYAEKGSTTEAMRVLERAFEEIRAVGMPRYEALIAATLAACAADEGAFEAASLWLERAGAAVELCASEPAIATAVGLHALHVELERATGAERAGIVARVRSEAPRADAASDDVRLAYRLLVRRTLAETRAPAHALVILAEGAGFRLPGASHTVDLKTRAPLRRILLALASLRIAQPGEPLSLDGVVRAGWPGERLRGSASANRVRVALATLRKLGLRDLVLTVQGGYLLDPAVPVSIEGAA